MSYRSVDSFRAGPGWSCSKAIYKPVWHIPLLSVQWINSWWWTDELSETCRVSWQNKFVKLVYLVGFITKKFWGVFLYSLIECEVWGCHNCVAENSSTLACDTVPLSEFWCFKGLLQLHLQVLSSIQELGYLTLEDKSAMILWNIRNLLPHDTELHPRRHESSVWYKLPCKVWGSYSSAAEKWILMGCDSLSLVRAVPNPSPNNIASHTRRLECSEIYCTTWYHSQQDGNFTFMLLCIITNFFLTTNHTH